MQIIGNKRIPITNKLAADCIRVKLTKVRFRILLPARLLSKTVTVSIQNNNFASCLE